MSFYFCFNCFIDIHFPRVRQQCFKIHNINYSFMYELKIVIKIIRYRYFKLLRYPLWDNTKQDIILFEKKKRKKKKELNTNFLHIYDIVWKCTELSSRHVEARERPFKVLGDFYTAGSRNGCIKVDEDRSCSYRTNSILKSINMSDTKGSFVGM